MMNQAVAIHPADRASHWHAALKLRLGQTARGTRLLAREHRGPLYVQRPFYPEGPSPAHLYLLHPPGGLVSGDELRYDIGIAEGASALFTTPGAGRFYGARQDRTPQVQQVHLQLEAGTCAEWLPLENIVYPGACAHLDTRVDLVADSSFLGWEVNCMGLPASEAPFTRGRLLQRFRLYREGRPLLLETLNLDRADPRLLAGAAGMGGHCVSGLLVATAPDGTGEAQLPGLRSRVEHAAPRIALTCIDTLLVARYLGPCTQEARALFETCWAYLRPFVAGRPACPPRIWHT